MLCSTLATHPSIQGGRKCTVDGCQKVSRGRTANCAAHGGGARCVRADCQRAAMGKSNLCRLHGTQQQQQKLDAETTTTKPGILDPVTAEPIVAEKKMRSSWSYRICAGS